MYTHFTIEKTISPLEEQRFTFIVIEDVIKVECYSLCVRESTKKRKYTPKYRYSRIDRRDSNINYEEIPLTKEIKEEALKIAREKITFE